MLRSEKAAADAARATLTQAVATRPTTRQDRTRRQAHLIQATALAPQTVKTVQTAKTTGQRWCRQNGPNPPFCRQIFCILCQ